MELSQDRVQWRVLVLAHRWPSGCH